jgi:hypothetical protein
MRDGKMALSTCDTAAATGFKHRQHLLPDHLPFRLSQAHCDGHGRLSSRSWYGQYEKQHVTYNSQIVRHHVHLFSAIRLPGRQAILFPKPWGYF